MENYPYLDCDLPFSDSTISPLAVPASSLEAVTLGIFSPQNIFQKTPKELTVYTRRKKRGKNIVVAVCSRGSV